MTHPVLALIWQSWRMARRWYLLVLLISTYLGWVLFHLKAPSFMEPRFYQLTAATPVFLIITGISCLSTLLAISAGSKNGFPCSFEYRLPVSTFMLVTAPMLFVAVLCASLYFIPLGFYRLVLDIPFPLLPGTTWLIATVMAVLCCAWSTTNNSARTFAVTCAIAGSIMLFTWFKPLHIIINVRGRGPAFDMSIITDIIAFDGFEYLVQILLSLLFLGITVFAVAQQRKGEPLRIQLASSGKTFSPFALAETLSDQLAIACPTTRAWQAEVWLECKRYVFPVVLFSVTVAVLIPVLTLFGAATAWPVALHIVALTPLLIYFTGIGLSVFNRRKAHNGYMNVFEGSRAMSTLQLASIQIVTIAIATGIGIALVNGSLYLSLPLAGNLGNPFIKLGSLLAPLPDATFLMQLNNILMENFIYVGIIAMFLCLHSCSVFWGRKSLLAIILVVLYALSMFVTIRNDPTDTRGLINLMWGISIFVSLLTVACVISIFRLRVISVRGGMVLLLGWLVFFGCSYFNLEQRGYHFSGMAAELLALTMALLLLPLTFAALTLWCYDRLRHT